MANGTLFAKTLRDQRRSLPAWAAGLFILGLYLAYLYPFFSRGASGLLKMIGSLPPIIKNLIGQANPMATPEGFFALQPFSIFGPLLFLLLAIGRGSEAAAGEFENGTLDLLLAHPISRQRLVLEKFFAQAVALALLALAMWGGLGAGTRLFAISLNLGRLAEAALSLYLLALAFLALTLALSCWSLNRRLSIAISGTWAVVSYLVNAYAPMVSSLRPFRPYSLFFYYNGHNPLVNGIHAGHAAVLAAVCVISLLAALLLFQRRDLA